MAKPNRNRTEFLSKCWVTWCEIGFGCRYYMCFHPEFIAPVGSVWCACQGGRTPTADVLYSFTLHMYRRLGVRTLINKTLLEHFKIIRTTSGTKEGGMKFLKASGYKHDPVRDDWYLTREMAEKASKGK